MKKLTLIFTFLITLSILSCKKDSDSIVNTEDSETTYKQELEIAIDLKSISLEEIPSKFRKNIVEYKNYKAMYEAFKFAVDGKSIVSKQSVRPEKSVSQASLLNAAPTVNSYQLSIVDNVTLANSMGTSQVGCTYDMKAKVGFSPTSGNGWSVQIISTEASSPDLGFSGVGQIEPGPDPKWVYSFGKGSFITNLNGYASVAGIYKSFYITVKGNYLITPPGTPTGVLIVTHSLSAIRH